MSAKGENVAGVLMHPERLSLCTHVPTTPYQSYTVAQTQCWGSPSLFCNHGSTNHLLPPVRPMPCLPMPPPPTHPLPSVPRTLIMQHAPTGCQTQESYEAASASLALRSWDLLGSRPGRPNILFEVNQPPNQPKTEVSWVGFWGFPGLAKAHPRRCCSQPLPARGAR